MAIAALYDIHGNLPALEAVLQELEQYDITDIVVGGDVIPGPMSRQCLDILFELSIPTHFILGNCEVVVVNAYKGEELGKMPPSVVQDMQWTAQTMEVHHINHISTWQKTINIKIEGLGDVLFCHATPQNENDLFTPLSSEEKLQKIFDSVEAPLVVCGHTHMQFDLSVGDVRVLNAGSVGMPFGEPGAYWLLLDHEIQFKKTSYDYHKAAEHISATQYPSAEDFAMKNVVNPPKETTMMEALK